ncbi:uncharacterized protein ACN427_010668 isoform 2-T2 [Glossina fuscipes fuscipes]
MLQENDGKRRHINQQMRDTIDGIKTMYEKCRLDKDAARTSRKETRDKSIQTSSHTYAQKVMERSGGVTPLQYASGEKRTQPGASKRKQPGDADTPTAKRRNVAITGAAEQHTASAPNGQRPSKDLEWQKVRAKMKKKRKADRLKERPAKGRPDAIVMAARGELSYADMLRKVKDEPQLSKFGEAVQKIRRTQKGELLLQLNQSGEKAEELRAAVGSFLGGEAEVRCLKQRKMVECKDIDEVTTREDISSALKSQYGVASAEVVNLRKAYGGTQTALITLQQEEAAKLLAGGKLRVGWVICRIRERTPLLRCFRCLEFGHIAKQCAAPSDRSKACRRCGEDGHIAKNCTKDPSCMFCRKTPNLDAKHVAGSGKCPLFKQALIGKARK